MIKTLSSYVAFLLIVSTGASAQRVGIGTINPLARLSVDSGIMIDQSNLNQGNLLAGALQFGSDGLVGINRSTIIGSGARSGIGFYTGGLRRMVVDSVGRVGIGTSSPVQSFHVSGNAYVAGNIGVGISSPQFDIHIAGSARIGTYLGINADPGTNRLRVNGDALFENSNVGINIAPSGSYSLYAAGNIRFTDAVRIDGDASIISNLTVGGRGIVRGSGAGQWRLVRLTVGYAGGLAANSDVIGAALAFNLGGATLAGIFVGPVVTVGAGASNLESLGLIPTNISNTGCRFLITNGSGTAANMGTNDNPTRWQLTMLVFD